MSAHYEKRDGLFYAFKTSAMQEAMIEARFDEQVDFDIKEWEDDRKQTKTYKKMCLFYVLMFIPEYIYLRTMMSKESAQERARVNKIYIRFLRNKLTLAEFKKVMRNNLSVT